LKKHLATLQSGEGGVVAVQLGSKRGSKIARQEKKMILKFLLFYFAADVIMFFPAKEELTLAGFFLASL
jgi:hypothetical protein